MDEVPEIRFRSERTGRTLRTMLKVGMLLNTVLFGFVLMVMVEPSTYAYIALYDDILSPLTLLVTAVALIIWMVWTYRVHRDLRTLWPDYPITPGSALARMMVPIYNIWGFWGIWKTMDEYLPPLPDTDRRRFLSSIGRFNAPLYATAAAPEIIDTALRRFPDATWLVPLHLALQILWFFVMFRLIETVTYGLTQTRQEYIGETVSPDHP